MMNSAKQQHLDQIRANSAYPTYRGMIGIIALIGNLLAALHVLIGLIMGLVTMASSFFAGVGIILAAAVIGVLIFFGARFWKEAALILADMGDSITEANSRTPTP